MKKKILLITIITLFTLSFISCSYKKPSNDNKSDSSESTDIEEGISKDSSNNTPPKIIEKIDEGSSETNSENVDKYKIEILNNIKDKAQNGMVINSEFKAKGDVIDKVNETYGKADTENYVSEAKGLYYAFESKNLAFGVNKGSQIFEVRSFDKSLGYLSLKDIISYFGDPQYYVITDLNERVIGYKVNDDFKLLFVFSDSKSEEASLHHYSVLYPIGTVNNMANDPGREW